MPPSESSNAIHNKVTRLFTYLEKALSLDDSIVRDFRSGALQPSPWWLAELPTDMENLYIRRLEMDASRPEVQDNVIIRVQKGDIEQAPDLPEVLREWVDDVNPLVAPVAKEKIDRKVKFLKDEGRVEAFKDFKKNYNDGDKIPEILDGWVTIKPEQKPEALSVRYVEDPFSDHPELADLLKKYDENEWAPWAARVSKAYKANLLYDQLYALRFLLKNEGDSYELLCGQGLLSWRHSSAGEIYAPLFLTPLVLDFDAIKRVIEISPDPLFRSFVDITSLHELDNPAELDVITWADKINADPFDFWHFETLKSQTRYLVNSLSNNAEDAFGEQIMGNPAISQNPSVWNAPIIFARKRNNDLWSKYAGVIRRDIEQNSIEPTEFIADLVGNYQLEPLAKEVNTESESVTLSEDELFFPLPSNDEQRRIAERLESNYGVVVKGPPGTGKSHTIANLISRFLAQGKTVLVTSQTSKALEVLRNKLPENIRSLAVSQLHQTAKQDQVLQESIAEISSNLGERQTKFSDSKAEAIRNELHKVRQEKAALASSIRKYILSDSQDVVKIDGEAIKPIDAAKLAEQYSHQQDLAWFKDDIKFNRELEFTETDLQGIFDICKELDDDDKKLYWAMLPKLDTLPSVQAVVEIFTTYGNLVRRMDVPSKVFAGADPHISREDLNRLLEQLEEAHRVLSSLTKDYEKEIFERCSVSEAERKKWYTALKKVYGAMKKSQEIESELLGYRIEGDVDLAHEVILEAIDSLRKRTANGAKIGGVSKLLLPIHAKRVLNDLKINGSAPDTAEELEVLFKHFKLKELQLEIKTLLEQSFLPLSSKPVLAGVEHDAVVLEVLVKEATRAALYIEKFADVDAFCRRNKQLAGISLLKIDDVRGLINLLTSYSAKYEIKELSIVFSDWHKTLVETIDGHRHPIFDKLIAALSNRNGDQWSNAASELEQLHDKKMKATRLHELTKKVQPIAPTLYKDIVNNARNIQSFVAPKNLPLAWKIARLNNWLKTIHYHTDIDELQKQLERHNKREYQLNSELVTILAWQRQIDRVSKRQRDALMMWSHSMKKYGKGTGKYANTHLRAAQEALHEAKAAVPVWIMPLHRVAQMFSDPKAGMFDVVIFDEASQCDIKGITIGYLGKKLLVVGDPEQISPAGIFQNQEKIFELISRFLFDIPYRESFSVTSSFFDLAKIRLSSIIQLNEHFRCVPEIIGFSNYHIYEGKLKPLRYPHPKGQLKPALVPVLVEGGYQNKNNSANIPEAEAIVDKLVACLGDPAYATRPNGKLTTFGIISLLGDDQVKYIKELILRRIDEKTIEEREIICGNAYAFQGDERDVIFMSMAKALNPDKPDDSVRAYTTQIAKQSFNVAASRARDQAFLFHSIPIVEYKNPEDWRFKLLNWFYNPVTEELNAGRESLKREFDAGRASQFSVDIGNILIDRGYQVIPEYPVIGYRIDLVVQGQSSRLAVECDGDQYHTLENWEADQAREQQLRRAGWEFWRVTGSAFYRHKEEALTSLWTKLDELGVTPMMQWQNSKGENEE